MGKSLVIVESPAKAKTINKYLGSGYVVKSSFGHVRDLPMAGDETDPADRLAKAREAAKAARESGVKVVKATPEEKAAKAQATLIRRMGVDPEHGWNARYEVIPGKEKVVADLKKEADRCEAIYLASDLDREGESIAWHLRELLGGDESRYRRVTFSEITKKAITEAFSHPDRVNMDRVNAQQARRFLDRVVGFMASPLLWTKVARGLSAGRVQSVAVRLIVEREREIRAFVPQEYWEVHADLTAPTGGFRAMVVRCQGEVFQPVNEAQAMGAVKALQGAAYRIATCEEKPAKTWPNAPFITSSLQAAASTRLGFSVKKTMTLAQRLYEAGHITYMRTDSVNISQEALTAVRELIGKQFGPKYLPEAAVAYTSKEGAQEAHEAIRPTEVRTQAADLPVEEDQKRLYDLIWRQFVACQMPPAEFDTTKITIAAAGYDLTASGRVLRFDGFFKVLPPTKEEEPRLPKLSAGTELTLRELLPSQHFTKPPPRFSEAGLVRELEKRGIGRPSTYASIISTIQERGYVTLAARRFAATKLGEIVTSRLMDAFPELMDYSFTAGLEEDLDEIAQAKEAWKKVLDRFYVDFKGKLDHAHENMRGNEPVPTSIPCPTCSREMGIRTARTGVFLGCSGYNLGKKERCTATINLVPGEEVETVVVENGDEDQTSEAEAKHLHEQKRCPKCGTAMDAYLVDEKRKLHICGNNPDCSGFLVEEGQFKLKGYDGPSIPCDKCGKPMQLRQGRFGKYFGCTGYPECANTRKLLRSGEAAPPKSDPVPMPELPCSKSKGHFVLRDGAVGLFLASSEYPRSRETRNPLVKELLPHAAEIPEKYQFLLSAPVADPEGHPAIIRFARKTRQHFVASEVDGKATRWAAFHEDGKWVVRSGKAEAVEK